MKNRSLYQLFAFVIIFTISGCELTQKTVGNINLFSVEDDIRLGLQVSGEIESDPAQFPILNEQQNPEVYRYVRNITQRILNSGKVKYKNEFKWQVKIINDNKTLNAFATPGGYIYVYTGLIKFLDSEDQLAGVMGHEIAHADRRHSTKQMTKQVGIGVLLDAALGKKDALKQVVGGLVGLKFSRAHESESDEYSVIYLCNTPYDSAGAAGFFKKMEGQGSPPEFLSTHPNPANRVQEIEAKAAELSCRGSNTNNSEYNRIKNLLN